MVRPWLREHRSLAATIAAGTVVVALVATVAVVSTGYTAQRLDLDDPSVWLTNTSEQVIGRANTEIAEIDTIVPIEGGDSDILQQGSTVIAVDRTDARADIIDVATATVEQTVPLPPDSPQVFLAGREVVVYSRGTGEVWTTPIDRFASFDAAQQPTLNVGAGSIVSVSDAGYLIAYSADAGQVRRIDAATSATVSSTEVSRLEPDDGAELTVTSVGRHWAVLDATSRTLEVDGEIVALADIIGPSATPVLQRASSRGTSVLVSWQGGLLSVPFGGGAASVLESDRAGDPAAPTVLGDCVFAAWGDGGLWRSCAGTPEESIGLEGMLPASQLVFRSNTARVVLNDTVSGASWTVQADPRLIDNWRDLIDDDEEPTDAPENVETGETVVDENPAPPVAVDDALGARPGRSTILPVLVNDYDPNGDVLVIDAVGTVDIGVGTLERISSGQQLLLTLLPTATGTIEFGYSISDGRGGTAQATVEVTVRSDAENAPPRQVRPTRGSVDAGGATSLDVLGDWVDPDGDPFYLDDASVTAGATVSHSPTGEVDLMAASTASGTLTVGLVVSDAREAQSGVAFVAVVGDVPVIADPFVVQAYAGREVTVSPLEHVRGGSGRVTLNAVPSRTGSTITPSYDVGTFRFVSDEVRTHYVDYVVTDGSSTVTGSVRVDVSAAPDVATPPITIPKTVFVGQLSRQTIDVASTDIDPAGGVLLVTDTVDVPVDSGVQAEVIDQRSVRVTLLALLSGPVTFGYEITNGLASARGSITVIELPPPEEPQPPVARDDTATARVGDAITIDVLANDRQPDGLPISLDPALPGGLAENSGLLFASGNVLRYLAPAQPGNFSAIYQIRGPDGQIAQAVVRIEVREPNVETNAAPVPTEVTARVLAGQTVRIPIPLTGIDPDGDSVTLLGQATNPQKGSVTQTGTASIDYEAGQYSAGTDTFTYSVIDALGARATGTIRVGISARAGGARSPVAVRDDVVARPGTAVSVQVLENDSDPDGGALVVVSAVPNDPVTTAVVEEGDVVTIRPPATEGDYGVVYTIQNQFGATSQNFVVVHVAVDAPLSYPVASDTVLTLADILGRDSIDVDVLRGVFFADGDSSELGLAVLEGYGATATVTTRKTVRVAVTERAQIIPFSVTHPQDLTIRAYAFIWVPGSADALPQIDPRAPALVVDSGEPLTIPLDDHVLTAGSTGVRLTDSSSVSASHANGDPLVVDERTLRFTSAPNYSGPASISFEVTDGATATDPDGRIATLVLAITVRPREDASPVFQDAVIDFEPGQERVIDLVLLTQHPNPDRSPELVYSLLGSVPAGFGATISGQSLIVTAATDAQVGTTGSLTVGVADASGAGRSGRITLTVTSSTRPTVEPIDDVALARRGETTVVDVLANDEATNPFPGVPLRVVSISGIDGGSLPPGVRVTASENGSRLTVVVDGSAEPVDAAVRYQVADATGDPLRYAFGTVRISVQDVPDTPVAPYRQADTFVAGELKLRITPSQPNNSAITGYRVTSASHGQFSQDCGLSLVCSIVGLVPGQEYRFSVVAVNDVGESAASALSAPYSVDYRPAAPTTVVAEPSAASAAPNGRSITITWPTVPDPDPGSPVRDYVVEITGPGVDFSANGAVSPFVTTAGGQLGNDVGYTVAVYARNSAQVISEADWRRATTTVRTVGPPSAPRPAPSAALVAASTSGDVAVTWGPSDPNGAGSVAYSIGRVDGNQNAPACSTGSGKPAVLAENVASGWVDSTAQDGAVYTYFVYADNGVYCTAAETGAIESKRPPGQASGSVAVEDRGPSAGQWDLRVTSLSASGTVGRYQYRLDGGAWSDLQSEWLTSRSDPSHYGRDTAVEFRACRDATNDFCGPASASVNGTPVDARAGVSSCVAQPAPGSTPGIVRPNNAPGTTETYVIAYLRTSTGDWTGFTYTDLDVVPEDATAIRVRATVTPSTGSSQTDSGYSEEPCGP